MYTSMDRLHIISLWFIRLEPMICSTRNFFWYRISFPEALFSLYTGTEVDSNTVCVISNGYSGLTEGLTINLHGNEFPTILCSCEMFDNKDKVFIDQMQRAIDSGCSVTFYIYYWNCLSLEWSGSFEILNQSIYDDD